MLKALLWKEFRELMPLCAMVLAAQFMLFGVAIYGWRMVRPAEVWTMLPIQCLIAFVVPLVAGFWQNAQEDNQHTFQFLLQRPATRARLFGAKLLFGVLVCSLLSLAPLIAFAVFAQQVFPDRGDAFHFMWAFCAGVWLLYTGAFLSGLRPARWHKSRHLPLLAGIFLFVLLNGFFNELSSSHPFWAYSLLILGPAVAVCFAIVAIYVGKTQDYS